MVNPLHERHREDKQARKNMECTNGMAEFKLRLDIMECSWLSQASAFVGAEQGTSCSARSSPKGMVVSKTSSGKNEKRKVAPTRQISRRDMSWFSRGRIMYSAHVEEEYLKIVSPQSSTDRVSSEESLHDLE
ncbi:hypothetical protein B296_00001344 [Ensete ventricosum]|uniref:Uncharacterized protein n=1 Tax=Ensete ventricosum TaxID=4639 RepID=A0A427B476_ENSVE|nr:hypothetical protein B296_00001344 [Ensete ventricosum]